MAEPDRTPSSKQRDATVREELPASFPTTAPATPEPAGRDDRGDVTIREAEIPRYKVKERGPTPEPQSAKDLISLLSVSGLRTPAEVSALIASLSPEDFKMSVDLLAGALVDRKQLTDYQVRKLLSGEGHRLVFQDFAIETTLGEGGIAKVYLARSRKTGQMVALKVVPPNDPRFDREVRAVAKLSHPNVVAVIDRGAGAAGDFLAMEWVEGPDLAKYVEGKGGKLSIAEGLDLLLQAARGVAHLHEHRIIHRDLKPQNFVRAPDGTLKLIDLGLARFDNRPSSFSGGENLTAEGSMLGTPSYMAPEQIKNASTADYRSDIYSLGCMLHYLVTGDRPFARFNPMETIEMQLMEAPPKLRSLRSDTPAGVDALFARMMSKDPKGRPQTMDEVIAALEELLKAAPSASAGPATSLSSGGAMAPLLIFAMGVAVLAGAVIWYFTR